MGAITLDNVTKSYGDVTALRNVSLSVDKGEIFGLLGPNGSGKTTMIKCITQLANMDSGTITVSGIDITNSPHEARKRIGLSPQEPKADRYFGVQRLLEYQAGYYGIPLSKARPRVKSLLDTFGLQDKADAKAEELSGGMMRKLSVLKGLLHEPDILILDEPTAALDVDARHELWKHVREVNNAGTTIFLTTHYIEEAEEMCERICVLRDGEILELEEKEKVMQELSQNQIRFSFSTLPQLPDDLPPHRKEGSDLIFTVSEKEQGTVLQNIMERFDEESITYENFTVKQDSLENIFRRLVNE